MRLGYVGKGAAAVAPGTTVSTLVVPADMVAADVLFETAALRYVYDTTALVPSYEYSARSLAAASAGQRFGAQLTMQSNGSTFDPRTNNREIVLLASAARTIATSTPSQTNYNNRGLHLYFNITVVSGTGGLQVKFQEADPVSGTWTDASAALTAITTTGCFIISYYPNVTGIAGFYAAIGSVLGRTWRVQVIPGDASSYTYSLAAAMIE